MKFFAIDSFDDAEFQERRFDLGFGSTNLDKIGNVSGASFDKGKFSSKKMNYFNLLSTHVDVKWKFASKGQKVTMHTIMPYQYTCEAPVPMISDSNPLKKFSESFSYFNSCTTNNS